MIPAVGAGTSVSILSVEMSHTVWSASTRSPASTRHATIVPSATETPIWGIVMSTSVAGSAPPGVRPVDSSACAGIRPASVGEELTACLLHAVDAGQDGLLERRRERDRDVRG